MTKGTFNLQDNVLNQVRKDNISVTIFLINGFKLQGKIRSFDNFTVLLEVNGDQQMIYKHAISTIIPSKNLEFDKNTD